MDDRAEQGARLLRDLTAALNRLARAVESAQGKPERQPRRFDGDAPDLARDVGRALAQKLGQAIRDALAPSRPRR